ncbi:MAG TPA: FAD-binding oxidoreductase [Candidatus Limnocylindrales bacterium]|nr:FAD-binding oxidoreductase [Candidatus Limnocylindrales bacterium]
MTTRIGSSAGAASDIGALRDRLNGELIVAGDAGYDEARRVYNAMIDHHPVAIARPVDDRDVVAAVRFASAGGLPIAIRGGGHSVPGFGTVENGLVIDLGRMRGVTIEPEARTARVAGGATWADVNAATAAHGLATTGGVVSTTGVGGLTLGGGIGYLARAYGLSCDNLESARVVTAAGEIVEASEADHSDLFWAIRGGGGNFGVATELRFRLHPVADVYGGPMFYDLKDAATVLRLYRDLIATAPEHLAAFPGFQIAPPLPFIPESRRGEPMFFVMTCWSGPISEGEAAVRPFRVVAPVVAEHVGPLPYPAVNSAFDGLYPAGLQHYWKTAFVIELTDAAIEAHLKYGPRVPVVNSTMHIYPINGACRRVPSDATAFAHREANFAVVVAGMWPDPADNHANIAWVRDYYAAIAPESEAGGYVNFMSGDDEDRVAASYGGNFARLREVKRRYDPDNLFRVNQNIPPA